MGTGKLILAIIGKMIFDSKLEKEGNVMASISLFFFMKIRC